MSEHTENVTMTVRELAKYLNLGINATYQLVKQPGFPSIWFGEKKCLIPKKEVDRWLSENAGKTVKLEVK